MGMILFVRNFKMKALVLGGTRFLGYSLVNRLVKERCDVTILNRGTRKGLFGKSVKEIYADRTDKKELSKKLSGKDFDAVFDISAYTPQQTNSIVELLKDTKIKRFVHCSTIAVYNKLRDYCIDNPKKIRETSERGSNSGSKNPFSTYGTDKSKCEDALFNANADYGFPVVILRPTYIYGPLDYTGRMEWIFDRVCSGKPIYLPKKERVMQQAYVEDVVDAFILGTKKKSSVGEAYNICNPECMTFEHLIEKIGEVAARTPRIKYNPLYIPLPKQIKFMYFPFPAASFCCDVSKSMKLGVKYTSLEDGLKKTFRNCS